MGHKREEKNSTPGSFKISTFVDKKHEETQESYLNVLWKLLEDGKRQLNLQTVSEEMIFLLGNTRSGKSTLRMLLGGNLKNLKAVGWPPCIVDEACREIGDNSGSSWTSVPQIFHVPNPHVLTWVDTPGWCDNRGLLHEIAGMHLLNQVANRGKRLKFLLVIPFQAFYEDADKKYRIQPFELSMQLIRHTSNPAAISLIVTKVDNHPPFNSDCFVIEKIVSKLEMFRTAECLKQSTGSPMKSQGLTTISVIDSVIQNENIFLVRRPNKTFDKASEQLCDIPTVFNDKNSVPYYQTVCHRLISFCEKLEFGEKLSNFSVAPSAEKEGELMKLFLRIERDICEDVTTLVNSFEESVKEHATKNRGLKHGKLKFLSQLTDAKNQISAFCELSLSTSCHLSPKTPSIVMEKVNRIFGNSQYSTLVSLQRKEEQLSNLLEVTNLPPSPSSALAEIFLSLKNSLNERYLKCVSGNQQELQTDLQQFIKCQIKNNIEIIQKCYQERYNSWTSKPGHIKHSLNFHLSRLRNPPPTWGNLSPDSTIKFIYMSLNLVLTNSVQDDLHQIHLAHSNLLQVGGYTQKPEEPIEKVKIFLEKLREKFISQLSELHAEIEDMMEEDLTVILTTLENRCVESGFLSDLCLVSIPNGILFLESVILQLGLYLEEFDVRCNQTSPWLLDEVHILQRQLQSDLNLFDIFATSFENWPSASATKDNLIAWRNGVIKLQDNIHSLLQFHKENSNVQKTMCNENSIIGRSVISDNNSELVLILTDGNANMSDIIRHHMTHTPTTDAIFSSLLILAGGTVFVDQNLVGAQTENWNLFVCSSNIKSEGDRMIFLNGKKGKCISGNAGNGEHWGDDGKRGADGTSGGKAGNIYIVTKEMMDLSSLTIASCGGDGGKGKNGGSGHCGSDDSFYSYQFCQKIIYCFKQFDDVCMMVCCAMGLKPPKWKEYQLTVADREKTPNAKIWEKVKMRLDLLRTIKFVIEYIDNQTSCPKGLLCFCTALRDVKSCAGIYELESTFQKPCGKVDEDDTKTSNFFWLEATSYRIY